MDEQKKYEVIKALADHPNGSKDRAALTLGCTKRHINRMLAGYRKEGKAFFVHGNKGRKPSSSIPEETRNTIIDLYRTKYYDANFQHFTELLAELEGIHVSTSSVRKILESYYILSPKVTKAKKKRIRQELLSKKEQASSKKDADRIQANLVAIEDAHPRRPRCAYFGEMQQMDATPYEWIPGQVWHLHLAIDDATGAITVPGLILRRLSTAIIMYSTRSSRTMAYLINSLQTVVLFLPIKRKTPHLSMRIPILNSPMPANSSASFWNPAACLRRKDVWNV